MPDMNKDGVSKILKDEISAMSGFDNWHGITADNLAQFLVTPYEVTVDPDDGGETKPRAMWVVLHERSEAEKGYMIAYDACFNGWALLEHTAGSEHPFVQVIGGDSLAEVLDGM